MAYRSKKGQSALEFLMTYGWAFLVALIVIGGLSYFGVLDPLSWLPARCKFGAGEITCSAYIVDVNGPLQSDGVPTNNGTVTLKLVNSVGKTIKIANMSVYTDILTPICCGPDSSSATDDCENYDNVNVTGTVGPDSWVGIDNVADSIGNEGTTDSILWLEGKAVTFKFEGCELESQAVQAGKKHRFFVDVKYYPRLDGPEFMQTIRGEVFGQTEG